MLYAKDIPVGKRIDGKIYGYVYLFDKKTQARAWVGAGRKAGFLRRIFKIKGKYVAYERKA